MKIKRAAIRDANYEKQRDQLIPIAEAYAYQVVVHGHQSNEQFNMRWNDVFLKRMQELAMALGIAVEDEMGS